MPDDCHIDWVVLTRGDRPDALTRAIASIVRQSNSSVVLVGNGVTDAGELAAPSDDVDVVRSPENLGIPGGRDLGASRSSATLVGFLDDDAELHDAVASSVQRCFAERPQLGAVSLRLVDEGGTSATRHVPRPGGRAPERSGDVATFLGGASVIRRTAYDEVGGYFTELFYGHEEVELSWRLIDAGWSIEYLADATVFHPRTEISRHAEGWRLTGRNRVLIARRTLPWPVAIVHVLTWLALGFIRAGDRRNRRAYLDGWRDGWTVSIHRRPIRWSTVWRLTRLGRPPVI
ncbi:MAG: glycosyltransferase [Actinomycetota bacterium]